MTQYVALFQAAIVFGTVIMYGAIGEILTEKSGNLNLGVPGIMYLGAIAGLAASFFYENGKAAKIPLSAYATKTNRRKLTAAYSEKSNLQTAMVIQADTQIAVYTTDDRVAIISTAQLLPKTTRNTIGVSVISLKKKAQLKCAILLEESGITNQSRYRSRTIPTAGAILKQEDSQEKQITFDV